jgi:hypothetical protein
MPTVAVVSGVKIQFYPREHPPPHFHAIFAEHRAQIEIETLRTLKGSLPRAKLSDVVDWAKPRRAALRRAWEQVVAKKEPGKIR